MLGQGILALEHDHLQTPLLDSTHPMKLALFCLGSKGAAVIVGSAGTAATANAEKAMNERAEKEYRPDIITDILQELKLEAVQARRRGSDRDVKYRGWAPKVQSKPLTLSFWVHSCTELVLWMDSAKRGLVALPVWRDMYRSAVSGTNLAKHGIVWTQVGV
jgi:hypothetical protein